MGCHCGGGNRNLNSGIAKSCNAYFATAYRKTIEKYDDAGKAMDVWSSHLKSFGLGDFLGYDLTIGKKGNIPDGAYYDNWYPDFKWGATTTISNAIGQGEVLVTPIQLANMTAAIANRGHYYTPHIIKSVEGQSINNAYTIKHNTTIDKRHFEPVVQGLFDVYNKGTASFLQVPGIEICGKTGTAENFTKIDGTRTQLTDHSIFIAFAPKDNPKIAIAVLVENGYFGARFAGRIASLMIEKYIKGSISRTDLEKWVMERTLEHEYEKPFSGEPFNINAKSQLMLVKDWELKKKAQNNQDLKK
jgi:penicillin-binding protein 2